MRRLSNRTFVAIAAAWSAAATVGAFQTAQPPNPSSGEPPVIRVVAVVTDARDQPLNGLKTVDFELLVDGKPQAIDAVDVGKADSGAPRTFAFLLDEFHTAADDSTVVRDTLLRFVDQQLRPADVVFVVKPLDPLTRIEPLADRDAVRRAISGFEGRKGDFTARTPFEQNYLAQAPEAVAAARAQIVTSALRAIGTMLSQKKSGRAAIVLVGDGFARMRVSRELPASLQTTIRIANRADASVYAFAPSVQPPAATPVARGSSTQSAAAPPAARGGAAQPAAVPPSDAPPPDPVFVALDALTTQTGGRLVAGTSSFDAGLARMARDLDAGYVLTYRPAHGSDGRFHALQLAIKRPGAVVRSRTGYVAPAIEVPATAVPELSATFRVMRRSVLIQSWSGAVPTAAGKARVMLTWEPASPRPGTVAKGRAASIVVTATAPDGAVLFDAPVRPVGTSPSGELPDQASFEAPVGPVRIDMKILDLKGVVIDTDARDVIVPGPRKNGPTIYAPAVLRTQSAREFRQASADPDAPAAASREFRRTERLLIRVPAVDASGEPTPVKAVLLNRLRQPMLTLSPMAGSPRDATVTQFDLPLASLAPGDYSLQLTASQAGGVVSEYVSFRVLG